MQISCRPSCRRPHKSTLPLALEIEVDLRARGYNTCEFPTLGAEGIELCFREEPGRDLSEDVLVLPARVDTPGPAFFSHDQSTTKPSTIAA
jgi:hypothetical protein